MSLQYPIETERLVLRRLTLDDAGFILGLLNEPSFLEHVGDKGVRDLEGARRYLLDGPVACHEKHGFGLDRVELRESGEPIGICGLLRRDGIDDVEVGFAFLPAFWGQGYATEAARASIEHGRSHLGVGRIVAIASPANTGSHRVLEKLGLRFDRMIRLSESEPEISFFVPGEG